MLLIWSDSNPTLAVYPQESGHQQHLGQAHCTLREQTQRVKSFRSNWGDQITNTTCLSSVCMYSIGAVSYPLPFRAAHMGLRLFTVTSPQLTQRVSNRLPAGTHEKHSCLSFRPAEFADKESFCALTHTDCSQLKQDFLAKESSQCTVFFFNQNPP